MHGHTTSEVCVWAPTTCLCVLFRQACVQALALFVGFVLLESLALRLLAIGAQVLGLGALDGVATNLMGVVAANLMGVVALGGIRSVDRRHPIAAVGLLKFIFRYEPN